MSSDIRDAYDLNGLAEFALEVNELSHEKGWWEGLESRGDDLWLEKRLGVVMEVAEAAYHIRQPDFDPISGASVWEHGDPAPNGYLVELADVLIRLLGLAAQAARRPVGFQRQPPAPAGQPGRGGEVAERRHT